MVGNSLFSNYPGGGWDDAVAANRGIGFYNHLANALIKNGFCIMFLLRERSISAE